MKVRDEIFRPVQTFFHSWACRVDVRERVYISGSVRLEHTSQTELHRQLMAERRRFAWISLDVQSSVLTVGTQAGLHVGRRACP